QHEKRQNIIIELEVALPRKPMGSEGYFSGLGSIYAMLGIDFVAEFESLQLAKIQENLQQFMFLLGIPSGITSAQLAVPQVHLSAWKTAIHTKDFNKPILKCF
ncbi:hypothetical protein ACJX0J_007695, partial [Zea mays]